MRAWLLIVLAALGGSQVVASDITEAVPAMKGLIHYRAPLFPVGLPGVMNGAADVIMAVTIDAQGKISDSVALQATDEVFVEAVNRALVDWQFLPMSSSTSPRREVVEFDFRRSGVITTVNHVEAIHEEFVSTNNAKIKTVQWKELDSEPQKLVSRMPIVSKTLLGKNGNKPVLINFILDKQGKVRVPVITTDDAELAQLVLDAVRQWRYSPPMYQGEAVMAEVTRELAMPGVTASLK